MAVQKFLSFRHLTPILAFAILLGESIPTSSADVALTQIAASRAKFPTRQANVRMGSFGAPGINLRNTVIFYSTCYGSGIGAANNAFLGRLPKTGKNGRIVARKGLVATAGTITNLCTNPSINNNYVTSWSAVFSTIVLDGQTQTITYGTYLFRTSRSGSAAQYHLYFPGQNIPDQYMDLNNRGAISLIAGDLDRPDAPSSVYRISVQAATPLVAVGETAIGLPLGAVYTEFGKPTIADNNAIVFAAKVSDTDNKFDGIWYGKNGDPNPLIVNGQATPIGGTFTAFSDPAVPSPSGKLVTFVATGGTGSGVFIIDVASGVITSAAHTGQVIADYSQPLSGIQPAGINNNGDVAFGVKTSGAALAATTNPDRVNAVFFVKHGSAEPVKVIATGEDVVVNGKEKRVIDIRFSALRGFNDLGYVAFTASFSDRTSGVFLAKP
jgi:hypothetical protein